MRWRFTTAEPVPVRRSVRANGAGAGRNRSSNWSIPDLRRGSVLGVEVDYAQGRPDRLCITIRATNHGPRQPPCTCADAVVPQHVGLGAARLRRRADIHGYDEGTLVAKHRIMGRLVLAGEGSPEALVCDNESQCGASVGVGQPVAVPQDGIG